MKAYTDLEQSKKLAEILPLESVDMCYRIVAYNPDDTHVYQPYCFVGTLESDVPCWSLAALLDVLPYSSLHQTFSGWRCDSYDKEGIMETCRLGENADNPVDACYEMILKLHELKIL